MKSAQPSSTQAFTEIVDIRENIVLLRGNNACIVFEVTSVNFTLLSGQEQDAKVFGYAGLLNSLSFPIQIIIRSKPIEINPYLQNVTMAIKTTANANLKTYMGNYRDFVTNLVKTTTVLEKQFFIVIPYSQLESGATSLVVNKTVSQDSEEQLFQQAKTNLETKADSLLSLIGRLSLKAKVLEKESLIKLFYHIYNQENSFMTTDDVESPMVKGG